MADNMAVTWHRMKKKVALTLKGKPRRLRVVARVEWEVAREERASGAEATVFEWDEEVCAMFGGLRT
jgi:hypothetical protein